MKKPPYNAKNALWIIAMLGIVIILSCLISKDYIIAAFSNPPLGTMHPPTKIPPGYIPPGLRNVTLTVTLDVWSSDFPPAPTYTPVIINQVIDLSPSLDSNEKFEVVVRHANGKLDKYLIGPLPKGAVLNKPTLPAEILNALPLKPGDEIWEWKPPMPYRRGQPTMVPSDTPKAYPAP